MDILYMREIPLSIPDPEKDAELVKSGRYTRDIQLVLWENGKPVGGTVWIEATPHTEQIPDGHRRDNDSYYRHRYKTSFSYNVNYNDLINNLKEYSGTDGRNLWNLINTNGTPVLYHGKMPHEDRHALDTRCWYFYLDLYCAAARTPNFDMKHLNDGLPVFLVQGIHMLNSNIAPKPVLDGVLVCRSSRAKEIKETFSNLEVSFWEKCYSTYDNNCFGSSMGYYNLFPDHAYGEGDVVAIHDMCLKLDLALKFTEENRLPFPFIIRLANPERTLSYTQENMAEAIKDFIYTYETGMSDEYLNKMYRRVIKNLELCEHRPKPPIFKPSKKKIASLTYCYCGDAYWQMKVPTRDEVQYLYEQICLFNHKISGHYE